MKQTKQFQRLISFAGVILLFSAACSRPPTQTRLRLIESFTLEPRTKHAPPDAVCGRTLIRLSRARSGKKRNDSDGRQNRFCQHSLEQLGLTLQHRSPNTTKAGSIQ